MKCFWINNNDVDERVHINMHQIERRTEREEEGDIERERER